MQKFNNWKVSFSSICYFEEILKTHRRVKSIKRDQDIFFRIERNDNSILNTLLVNTYRFGIASLIEALEEFPEAKYIVIGGNWNKITPEAAKYASDNDIGLYRLSEFIGAINYNNVPLEYIKKDER